MDSEARGEKAIDRKARQNNPREKLMLIVRLNVLSFLMPDPRRRGIMADKTYVVISLFLPERRSVGISFASVRIMT